MDDELFIADRQGEIGFERMAGTRDLCEIRSEERVGIASRALRDVHRKVGADQEIVIGCAVGGTDRNADADADGRMVALELEGNLQRLDHLAGTEARGLDRLHPSDDGDELVAPDPGEQTFAGSALGRQQIAQALGHHPEQLVASLVPESVVDGFEAIEVEEEQRSALFRADQRRRIDAHLLPIGNAAHRVVESELTNSLSAGPQMRQHSLECEAEAADLADARCAERNVEIATRDFLGGLGER